MNATGKLLSSALLAFGLSLLASACGGGGAANAAGANTTAAGAVTTPGTHMEPPAKVEVLAATEAEAHRLAETRVAERVFGDARWIRLAPVALLDRSHDTTTAAGVQTKVSVTLDRARVAKLLDAFEAAPLQPAAPPMWMMTLEPFLQAHRANHVCSRRKALLAASCELIDTMELDANARALFDALELLPQPARGLPIDAAGRPLRPLKVQLLYAGNPMPEVVLTLKTASPTSLESLEATTGVDGRASFAFVDGMPIPNDLVAQVDRGEILGALADLVPHVEQPLPTRSVSMHRWTSLVVEHSAGRRATDRIVASSIGSSLLLRGAPGAVPLPTDVQRALGAADARQVAQRLHGTADRLDGEIDVLLFVEADSEYASRMGSSRVWFEARGTMTVYDLWTTRALATVSASVTADGLGDQRADQAARKKLGEALVERLIAQRNLPWPTKGAVAKGPNGATSP